MNGMSEQTGTFLEQPRKPSLAGENLKKSSSHRGTIFWFFSPSQDLVWEMNDFSLFFFRLWGEKHGYSLLEVNFGVTYQRLKKENISPLSKPRSSPKPCCIQRRDSRQLLSFRNLRRGSQADYETRRENLSKKLLRGVPLREGTCLGSGICFN